LEAEILYKTAVEKVMEDSGRAVGVRLENGEKISADYVFQTLIATIFKKLIDDRHLTDRLRSM
jgi:phytoene dehydrogenase-like protein